MCFLHQQGAVDLSYCQNLLKDGDQRMEEGVGASPSSSQALGEDAGGD